jgi:RNAse (barnase) inhibitor barstar
MKNKSPAALAELDNHVVSPLGALAPDDLQRWARAEGQRCVQVDLTNLRTRKAALQAIGKAFGFPRWYGANLDALYDCLTDLPESQATPGYVVLLTGFGEKAPREGLNAEDRALLLDVFRDAAAHLAGGAMSLRVFYA